MNELKREIEAESIKVNQSKANERTVLERLEKAQTEKDIITKLYDDLQDRNNIEMSSIKRELHECNESYKQKCESLNQCESELTLMKRNAEKIANDSFAMKENIDEVETQLKKAYDRIKEANEENEELKENTRKYKRIINEFEDDFRIKSKSNEKYRRDFEQLEIETLNEVKRLHTLLSANEKEMVEMRSNSVNFQREINEYRAKLNNMQHSTNSTVNNLLEELRNTEDSLSNERKQYQQNLGDIHASKAELQLQMERLKCALDERESHGKIENSEKVLFMHAIIYTYS